MLKTKFGASIWKNISKVFDISVLVYFDGNKVIRLNFTLDYIFTKVIRFGNPLHLFDLNVKC